MAKKTNGQKESGIIGAVISELSAAKNDYKMAKRSRFIPKRTGLPAGGGTGDFHVRNETQYFENIEKARDMDRNDIMAGQLLDRVSINIVQDGFSLDPKTGDKRLDAHLVARWRAKKDDPELMDIAGEMTWHDFEYGAIRSMFRDGDCGIAGCEGSFLQFIEAHALKDEDGTGGDDVVLGIEIDEYRRKMAFAVSTDVIDPNSLERHPTEWIDCRDENGVRQFFHVYNPKRTTMTRGITAFAPLFEEAGMLEDINFSKLVQQSLVSCFAIFRQTPVGGTLPSADAGYGSQSTETTSTGETRVLDGIAPGMEIVGAPGETLEGFSPNVPNSEYFQQVEMITRLMSTAFGVPLMVLLLDASQTNFSGWRGAIDEARKGFRWHQRNLIKRLHAPFWKWQVNQWRDEGDQLINAGFANTKVDPTAHVWNPPAWKYIEPMKDASADLMRVRNGLISPRRLHQENSQDFAEIMQETVDDNANAISVAIKRAKLLSRRSGEQIHWRELLSLPTPDGVTVSVQAREGEVQGE